HTASDEVIDNRLSAARGKLIVILRRYAKMASSEAGFRECLDELMSLHGLALDRDLAIQA
ncbi:MAG: hypothetical protein EBX64_06710, partial [Betaproteobacteria bacterium]|nr:hypothetical protein [Betaproteobacteria bacterium]